MLLALFWGLLLYIELSNEKLKLLLKQNRKRTKVPYFCEIKLIVDGTSVRNYNLFMFFFNGRLYDRAETVADPGGGRRGRTPPHDRKFSFFPFVICQFWPIAKFAFFKLKE
jgi:hypothetical protein